MKQQLKQWSVTISTALLICASYAMHADAITITGSASPPTQDIVESQPDAGSNNASGVFRWTGNGSGQHEIAGQTFNHSSSFTLGAVTLLLNPLSNASSLSGAGVSISLYTFPANNTGIPSPTTPFLTETGSLPAGLVNNTASYITFDITDQNLSASTQYGWTVDFTGGPAAGLDAIWVNHLASTAYPQGVQVRYRAFENLYSSFTDDLVFYALSPSTPPPSVLTPNATRMETFDTIGLPNQFVEVNNTHDNGDNFGFSNTSNAGGSAGEAGGTFARTSAAVAASSYSDIDLVDGLDGVFDRTKTLVVSGKGIITDATNPDGNIFVGYTGNGLQLIGLHVLEPANPGDPFRARAAIHSDTGQVSGSAILTINEDQAFDFDLVYTDDGINDNGIAGDGIGTLFGTIAGTAVTVTGTAPFSLSNSTFNKFGVISGFAGGDNPAFTIDAFFDDLTYSIFVVPEPSSFGLAIVGLLGIVASIRHRRALR